MAKIEDKTLRENCEILYPGDHLVRDVCADEMFWLSGDVSGDQQPLKVVTILVNNIKWVEQGTLL